jgi:putative phosphoribosyl transferase
MIEPFRDRNDAGLVLAKSLNKYVNTPDLLVLGLPRGGVVVAYQVAIALGADLDVFLVRKLGVPTQPELAMGAIAEGGVLLLNDAVVNYMSISKDAIDLTARQELIELERRERVYRNGRFSPVIKGRTVIIVDDGIATGATMKVAIRSITRKEPSKIIVAVPVGSQSACMELKSEVDEVICISKPEPFIAVGSWYMQFEQTTDEEVTALLQKAFNRNKLNS